MERKSLFPRGLIIFGVASLIACGRNSDSRRLSDFKVEFGDDGIPAQMTVGETTTADVVVKNTSKNRWPSKPNQKGRNAVNLSYHWLDRNAKVVVFDGARSPLPKDVEPGETIRISAKIQPPSRAGQYTIEVTLVQELVAWFPDRDGDKLTRSVRVINPDVGSTPASSRPQSEKLDLSETKIDRTNKPEKPLSLATKNASRINTTSDPERDLADTSKIVRAQSNRGPVWTVQLAAVPQRIEAERLAEKLSEKTYDAYIERAIVGGMERYRVRVGRLASRSEAVKLQALLKSREGFAQSFIATVQ